MYLNVIDVEATCWSGQPPPGETSEIIEIGLCVVDLVALERVERRSILVCPRRSRVSPFCTGLTSLTQDQVDEGVSFEEACNILAREHDAGRRVWASWGDYDRKQFVRQGGSVGSRHINAKTAFAAAHDLRRRPGMAQALEIAGLPLEGRHHRGDDDAWNIAALVLGLVRQNRWPEPVEHASRTL